MRSQVANASDRNQVRKAQKSEDQRERTRLEDLRSVLATGHGRRTLQWIIGRLDNPHIPVWRADAMMNKLAAERDVANWIRTEIEKADPHALFNMNADALRVHDAEAEPIDTEGENLGESKTQD